MHMDWFANKLFISTFVLSKSMGLKVKREHLNIEKQKDKGRVIKIIVATFCLFRRRFFIVQRWQLDGLLVLIFQRWHSWWTHLFVCFKTFCIEDESQLLTIGVSGYRFHWSSFAFRPRVQYWSFCLKIQSFSWEAQANQDILFP